MAAGSELHLSKAAEERGDPAALGAQGPFQEALLRLRLSMIGRVEN
jgi:hypothetical protein